MWALPSLDGHVDESDVEALFTGQGMRFFSYEKLKNAKHIFTHIEWHMRYYFMELEALPRHSSFLKDVIWAGKKDLEEQYTMPNAYKSYLPLIMDHLI